MLGMYICVRSGHLAMFIIRPVHSNLHNCTCAPYIYFLHRCSSHMFIFYLYIHIYVCMYFFTTRKHTHNCRCTVVCMCLHRCLNGIYTACQRRRPSAAANGTINIDKVLSNHVMTTPSNPVSP